MSAESRTINQDNLSDAIELINESSRGMSFEYHLDTFSFLSLSRYWNFSYDHSLIHYVDDEPAALILNCVDPAAQDAFTFYWGAVQKFRSRRISLPFFEASCKHLQQDGYVMLHGDAVRDRPVRRYRFLHAEPQRVMFQMQAQSPQLPPRHLACEVRRIDVSELSRLTPPHGEPLHWCQRNTFLEHAAPLLQFLGAFSGDALEAYAVLLPQPSNTILLDLRSATTSFAAGYELLRCLLGQDYRPPITATHVLDQTYAHRLLTAAKFHEKSQSSTLSRNLRALD
jgi:hypothetical protein